MLPKIDFCFTVYWKKPWNWTKTTFNYPVFFICPISPSFSFSGVYFAWLWTHFDFLYWDTTILLLLSCEFLETLVMQLLMLIATIFHCYILISLFLFSLLCEFSDLMEARRKSCIVGKECIFWRRLTCDFCLFDLFCPSWNIQFFIVFQFQFCPIFILLLAMNSYVLSSVVPKAFKNRNPGLKSLHKFIYARVRIKTSNGCCKREWEWSGPLDLFTNNAPPPHSVECYRQQI